MHDDRTPHGNAGRPHTLAHRHSMRAAHLARNTRKQRYEVVARDHDTPCWAWLLKTNEKGYGSISVTVLGVKRTYLAHRYFYEQTNGPIAAGLTIDHLCNHRDCVNPEHMEPVTQGENVRRGLARRAALGLPRYSR